MDAFVTSTSGHPKCLFQSIEIKDKDSVFIGAIYPATSLKAAKQAIKHHKLVVHGARKAACEMAAWRIMSLKAGKDGLSGPQDFEVSSGSDDDGEKYGGNRILKILQRQAVIDVVVIVSRWFGGTLLGPVRFTHIENCASEVCSKFKAKEQMDEHLDQLKKLDNEIDDLRKHINRDTVEPKKLPSYDELLLSMDLAKAKRLITAREKAIASLKKLANEKTLSSGSQDT